MAQNATLPPDLAEKLELTEEGDMAQLTVTAVNDDGSVEVECENEKYEDEDYEETPEEPMARTKSNMPSGVIIIAKKRGGRM